METTSAPTVSAPMRTMWGSLVLVEAIHLKLMKFSEYPWLLVLCVIFLMCVLIAAI